MRLWHAPYHLVPMGRLGSRASAAPRAGALLRLETAEGAVGYADLHPWPELGDAPLPDQLAALARGDTTSLSQRSLACAHADAEARTADRSLWAGLQVPPSHYLVTDTAALASLHPEALYAQGFRALKCKVGADLPRELDALAAWDPEALLRWRLDLNASVDCEAVVRALERLRRQPGAAPLHRRIDFLEDPCPYGSAAWRGLWHRFHVGIALDREALPEGAGVAPPAATHRVIKPAAEDPEGAAHRAVRHGLRLVITSYLDHPVGQLHAARAAGTLAARHGAAVDTCGLWSEGAYEPTAYREALPVSGPHLDPTGLGPGIGLGDLLEAEDWVPL